MIQTKTTKKQNPIKPGWKQQAKKLQLQPKIICMTVGVYQKRAESFYLCLVISANYFEQHEKKINLSDIQLSPLSFIFSMVFFQSDFFFRISSVKDEFHFFSSIRRDNDLFLAYNRINDSAILKSTIQIWTLHTSNEERNIQERCP